MSYKKALFFLSTIIFIMSALFLVSNPVISQDDSLPPLVIQANDFPLEDDQSVLMEKQLWGDRNEISFETTSVIGTKQVQGKNARIVKSSDTNGEIQEDYFLKDGSSVMYLGTTREKWDKLVPARNIQFPLKLGSEWTVIDREISGRKVLITCKVVSHEFVKVPAGIFQSLKIETISKFADEKPVKNSYIWVVPGKGIVKEIQQLEENLTQIRELVYFYPGNKSLVLMAASVPPGGQEWSGSGTGLYKAYGKHPESDKVLEQNIELSYNFTFTINPQSGFIRGQGEMKVSGYKNSWNGKSLENTSGTFNFIGKKDGDVLKFYDGFILVKPEMFQAGGKGIPLMKVLDQMFRIPATIKNGTAGAYTEAGSKGETTVKIKWQAKPN